MSSAICKHPDCTRHAIRKVYCYTHLKELNIKVNTCKHPGCDNVSIARQLCSNHYKQAKRQEFKDSPLMDIHYRINHSYVVQGDCHIWTKSSMHKQFPMIVNHTGKQVSVQRLLYQEQFGVMPRDHVIYMTCKNSLCVNVQHMQSLTQTEMLHLKLKNKQPVRSCGDDHFYAKLTAVKVEFILSQLKKGKSGAILAEQFGVTRQLIHQIKKRKIWKHVT